MFHGSRDRTVPVSHGRRLRDLARHGILDRSYLGEFAYGPVYRGGSRLTMQQLIHIERNINRVHGTDNAVIICLPPWHVVESVWTDTSREEMFRKQGIVALNRVYEIYRLIAAIPLTTFRLYRYDWTREEAFFKLLEWLENERIA